jgi:hypothetical protein
MPVKKHKSIPKDSLMGKSFGAIDYYDSYSICINNKHSDTIDSLFIKFNSVSPLWMQTLMNLRNFLVKFIGLKTGKLDTMLKDKLEMGDKFGFFTIKARNHQEIVFGEDDKHLYFESSLLLKRCGENEMLYSITLVKFHNFTGQAYFFFVKPFHKLIIWSVLKRLAKMVEEN